MRFYVRRIAFWRSRMGAAGIASLAGRGHRSRCPQYLARVLQGKAYGLRIAYGRWLDYQYAWWKWLPDKFRRVGHCETGSTAGGTAAGNWHWDSGTYVSAFGIYRPAYEAYHHWTGRNTPREQYEVAAAIQESYGWGAWGCGGA